jgi:hypothetical protein
MGELSRLSRVKSLLLVFLIVTAVANEIGHGFIWPSRVPVCSTPAEPEKRGPREIVATPFWDANDSTFQIKFR